MAFANASMSASIARSSAKHYVNFEGNSEFASCSVIGATAMTDFARRFPFLARCLEALADSYAKASK